MVYFMMADGFEEAEALVPFDILERCGVACRLVSFGKTELVTGSHGIRVSCDLMLKRLRLEDAEAIIFPGGGKGTENLDKHPATDALLEYAISNKLLIGAICAAPSILGKRGLLDGKKATCYPGFEKYLTGAEATGERVVVDEKLITAKGAGASFEFGYALATALRDASTAQKVKDKIY